MHKRKRQILTTGEAALRLGISTVRVRQLFDSGELVGERTPNGTHFFDSRHVEALARRRARARGLAAAA